ncbi:hypothetical protein VTO42DRAFT_2314 [Malbranchea cinnamomea]
MEGARLIKLPSKSPSEMTQEEFEERMKEVIGALYADGIRTYDIFIRDHVRFESASLGPPTTVTYRATVAPELCNKLGTLHGGCAATLVDVLTSTILLALGQPGSVSRSLGLKYVRAAPMGVDILITSELVHVGRKLALLKCEIRRADTRDVCVVGEHDKANTGPIDSAKL